MITPEQITAFASQPENQEAFAAVLEKVLPDYTRFLWGQPVAYKKNFLRWQQAGFTLYPNHYYSPVPDLTRLPPRQISGRTCMAGIHFDTPAMLRLADSFFARFASEYVKFGDTPPNNEGKFFLGNGVYERIDAEILHSMIRHHRPKRMIEIGSGYSSLISAAACERNRAEGHPVEFSLIEPYPNDLFLQTIPGISHLHRKGVEECPIRMFEGLEAGDILFIDSSHVIRAGNDVEYEYFEIIPRLKPGVIIHIHDIFLPFRYPEDWIRKECIFWNEQYLVEALLMHNPSFKVLWAGCHVHTEHPEHLVRTFPGYDPKRSLPGSICWYANDDGSTVTCSNSWNAVMYSLALILFFIYCWWLFGGLGLAFPESLYCGGPLQRIGTVLSLGIATATIVATVGYFWGLSTLELCLGLSLVAGVSWLRVTVRLKNMRLPSDCYLPLFITLVGCLLALLPALVGGLQFSLFQGNHHDSFNYLESAITHARLSYQAVQQSDMLNIDNLGGFHYAHVNLLMRPSVVILYGTLCHFFSDYTLGNHYAFLVSLMSCAMVILAGLIQSLTPWLKSWQTLLLSGSVILGFWGQYIVDINAWSQVAWLPLFTYSVAFPLSQIPTPETASQSSTALRLWLPWWITLVAMVYMYPEAAAYSFVPLASLALFCLIKNGMRLKLVPFFFLGVIASIFFVPVYRSNIQFLVQQAGQATSSYDWWKYFQAFLGGRDGFVNGPFAGMADGIAGCLGLYYLTPDSNLQPALQAIWRISYFGILAIIFFATYQALRLTRREISLRWKAIVLLIGLLVVETVFLFWKRQYWSAGKGLSFFASIVLAMGLGALAQGTNDRWWNICKRALLFSLVISGLGMAGARVMGAGRHSGILYRPPYPSIQGDLLKTTFDYGDHTFLAKLGANDYVEIDIDNPWVEEFVHMELYIREIPFYLARPIRTNRYSEISIGQMTVQRAPTARLTVEVDSSRAVPSFVKLTRISPPAK